MTTQTLQLRKTFKYVGTYKHLDEHEDIGTVTCLYTRTQSVDDHDPCEPVKQVHEVQVESDRPHDTIRDALRSHYSRNGCAHEFDCCGCRSYSVEDVKQVSAAGRLWRVEVYSARNF